MALNMPTEKIARACARHPWQTIVAWLMLLTVGGLLSLTLLSSNLTTGMEFTTNVESKKADDLLKSKFPEAAGKREIVIVTSETCTVDDQEFQQRLDDLYAELQDLQQAGVVQDMQYYDPAIRSGLPMLASALRQMSDAFGLFADGGSLNPDDCYQTAAALRATAGNLRQAASTMPTDLPEKSSEIPGRMVQTADGMEQAADGLQMAPNLDLMAVCLHKVLDAQSQFVAQTSPTPEATIKDLRDSAGQLRSAANTLRDNGSGSAEQKQLVLGMVQAADGMEQASASLEMGGALYKLASAVGQLVSGVLPTAETLRASMKDLQDSANQLRDTANSHTEWMSGSQDAQALYSGLLQAASGQEEAAAQLEQAAAVLELGAAGAQLGDRLQQWAEVAGAKIDELEANIPPGWESQVALLRMQVAIDEAFAAVAHGGADLTSVIMKQQLDQRRDEIEAGIRQAEDGVTQLKSQFAGRKSDTEGGIRIAEDGLAQMKSALAERGPQITAGAAEAEAGVAQALSALVSEDRRSTLMIVYMADNLTKAASNVGQVRDVVLLPKEELDGSGYDQHGFRVLVTGDANIARDMFDISEADLKKGDAIAIPFALGILAVVIGTIVAALVPVVLGLLAIVVALGMTALVGQTMSLSFSVANIIFMLGLAVGIDYSLFIVSRYREERKAGKEKVEAIATAGSTATRAVFFSGMTVIVALMGILLVPSDLHRSLAVGAILVVIAAVAAAMTMLPALLSVLGHRIDYLRVPLINRPSTSQGGKEKNGFWHWITRPAMRFPVISLVTCSGVLLLCAFPLTHMKLGQSYVDTLPQDTVSRDGLEALGVEFSRSLLAPMQVVIDGYDEQEVYDLTADLTKELTQDSTFCVMPLQVNQEGNVAVLTVLINGDPFAPTASDAVRNLRQNYIGDSFQDVGGQALVTGYPAFNEDFFAMTGQYMPIIFAFVLGLSFLFLLVVFRSVVIPLASTIMNLLSVGAAYGLVVLVFQDGVGATFFGFSKIAAVDAWIPVFLFCILFGLSMDYFVFLLSRIRERYDQTRDNTEAINFGIRATAGLIIGAALIMVAVFAGTATGKIVILQEMGFGLAVAVIMDATLVAIVFIPAVMKLLGKWNWYFPSWLRWLPDLRVEPPSEVQAPPVQLGEEQPDWDFVVL